MKCGADKEDPKECTKRILYLDAFVCAIENGMDAADGMTGSGRIENRERRTTG